MHTKTSDIGIGGQPHPRIHHIRTRRIATDTPQRPKQPAIAVTLLGQPRIKTVRVNGLHHTHRRRRRGHRGGRLVAQHPAGMQRPPSAITAHPGMHGKRPARVVHQRTHRHLHIGRRMLHQHQRGMQHQLVDHQTTQPLTGGQHHINEPRRREQHPLTEHVPGQPTLRRRRQPPTHHDLVLISQLGHRTQQRVLRRVPTGGADIPAVGRVQPPIGAVLEGVGRQFHGVRVRVKAPPRRAMTMGVQPAQRRWPARPGRGDNGAAW